MNFTQIVLIPKKNNPQHITDFRPISLSNVVTRIVSKLLANHLKMVLSMSSLTPKVLLFLVGSS